MLNLTNLHISALGLLSPITHHADYRTTRADTVTWTIQHPRRDDHIGCDARIDVSGA